MSARLNWNIPKTAFPASVSLWSGDKFDVSRWPKGLTTVEGLVHSGKFHHSHWKMRKWWEQWFQLDCFFNPTVVSTLRVFYMEIRVGKTRKEFGWDKNCPWKKDRMNPPTTPLSMDGHTWTKLKLMGFFDSMIWQDQLEVSFQTNFRNDNWKTQTLQI